MGSSQHASVGCSWPMQLGNVLWRVTGFLHIAERSNAPSLQPEGGTAGFLWGFMVKCVGRVFWERQRGITGHPMGLKHRGTWTTRNGARKGGKELQGDPHVLLRKGA